MANQNGFGVEHLEAVTAAARLRSSWCNKLCLVFSLESYFGPGLFVPVSHGARYSAIGTFSCMTLSDSWGRSGRAFIGSMRDCLAYTVNEPQ